MKAGQLSRYFFELHQAYQAELDDLKTDFEGNHVLKKRLAEKRSQFCALLPMLSEAPEMIAPIFYQAFQFQQPALLTKLLTQLPQYFPSWLSLAKTITIAPFAQPFIDRLLEEVQGETFLVTVAGLEYLQQHPDIAILTPEDIPNEAHSDTDLSRTLQEEVCDTSEEIDIASDNWLAEQGFDRKD